MKRGIGKRGKVVLMSLFLILAILLIASIVSAGFFDRIKKTITGYDVQSVVLNITVGGPEILYVYNDTMTDISTTLNAGPSPTGITINFSAYLGTGTANLNHTTASINFSNGGDLRSNSSCSIAIQTTNYINYTCNVTMWWWDGSGTWNINAYIEDNQTNSQTNISATFQVGSTKGFELSPGTLTWAGLSPGQTNKTSSNHPLLLNNTGNFNTTGLSAGNLSINATDLTGETTDNLALWAQNFSVSWDTGSSAECDTSAAASGMSRGVFANLSSTNISAGNYTINNGYTGQEQLYFCLNIAGNELTSQSYSTAANGTWTIQMN